MAGDDDVIEEVAVVVRPELAKNFTRDAQTKANAALKGVTASIRLVADKTGFAASAREQLKLVRQPEFKVKLVADTKDFERQLRTLGGRNARVTVRVGADSRGAARGVEKDLTAAAKRAAEKAERELYSRIRKPFEKAEQGELQAYAADIVQRIRVPLEAIQRAEAQAYVEAGRRSKVAADARIADEKKVSEAAQREADKRARIAESEAARAVKAAERETNQRSKSMSKAFEKTPIIDFGGKGIRPMNLLWGSVVALTPALFAMGASALQASTSVAALGAAGIGTALSLGGLLVAFQGITNALKLRKSVLAAQETAADNTATAAVKNASDELQLRNRLIDTQQEQLKAERDLHTARTEAARDLVDLRQKVADLQNQQKDDTLSVAEAQVNRNKVYRNFFASALDRARADQDVNNARTKLSDTTLNRKQAQADLTTSVQKGVENSDKVVNARDQLRQARERRAEALADRSATKLAGTATKVTSPMAQLQQQIKDMSPAAREMYQWFVDNDDVLKRLKRTIEAGVLPGFTDTLKTLNTVGKDGKTSLDLAASAAGRLGGKLGDTANRLARKTETGWFRKDFATIVDNNARAMDIMGDATVTMVRPLSQITRAASPLLVTVAGGLRHFATWFSTVIDKADRSGALTKWFEDAGKRAGVFVEIAKNLAKFLGNLFTLSLPAGDTLIDKFEGFTRSLADWSGSNTGQQQIAKFFGFFRDLPYGKIRDFFVQATGLFFGQHAVTWLAASPWNAFLSGLMLLAKEHPDAAIQFMSALNTFMTGTLGYLASHEQTATTLLAILGAARLAKSLNVGLKIAGIDSLRSTLVSRFAGLDKLIGGGATTGTMTVKAAVVNVYGAGAAVPGVPGSPGTVTGPGTVLAPGAGGKTPVNIDPKTGKPVYINNGRVVVGDPALKSGIRARLSSAGGGVAAIIGGLAAQVVIDQIFADAKSGSTKAAMGHALSGAVNGAMIGMAAGPVGAAVGAGIGALVSLAVHNEVTNPEGPKKSYTDKIKNSKSPIAGQMLNEAGAMAKLLNSPGLFSTANDPAAAKGFSPLQDYIRARIMTVTAGTNNILTSFKDPKKGQQAASQYQAQENERSRVGLQKLLQQYGWTADAAKKYAEQVYGVIKPTDGASTATYNFGQGLFGTGKKVDTAHGQVKNFKTALDEVNGQYVVTVTTNSGALKKVFNDLTDAVAYQEILRTGAQPTTAKMNQIKNQITRKNTFAQGGPVWGSGTATSDSIPAWLSNGEYVMPAQVVQHYGLGAMDAMKNRQVPRYAKGGPVSWPYPVKLPVNEIAARAQAAQFGGIGGGVVSGDADVARIAEATARALGASDKQLLALFEAGLVESGLRNLTRAVDHDSLGFLQQRPSQGWGTPEQITNVAYATRKFIQAAKSMDVRGISAGELAARVQRPAKQYRARYGERAADAAAVINAEAPYLSGYTPGAGGANQASLVAFGRWLQARGYDVSEHPAFGGVHGGHVKDSKHYRGQAFDVNHGAGTSAAEQRWLAKIIPEAHRRGFKTIFMAPNHYDHAHVSLAKGGPVGKVPARKYDTGGTLPPGYTLAYNGTGRNETVRTSQQENALTGPIRLDRRDIALLAAHIAGATSPTVHMDGRKVAEVINAYTYLPAGV